MPRCLRLIFWNPSTWRSTSRRHLFPSDLRSRKGRPPPPSKPLATPQRKAFPWPSSARSAACSGQRSACCLQPNTRSFETDREGEHDSAMRRLIVNADDFGFTEQVSRGILDAHREGIVTSTTLMANGAAFDAAVAMSRQAPRLGIGVHLNLTEGEPVSPALRIPSLVDGSGRLHLTPARLLKGLFRRQINLGDVETELRRQITRILSAGISPTHLDGHKHVHVLPGVSEIVIRLAQEFSIRRVRCPQEEAPPFARLLRAGRNSGVAAAKQYIVGRAVSGFA